MKIAFGNSNQGNLKSYKSFVYSKSTFENDFKKYFNSAVKKRSIKNIGVSILNKENEKFLKDYLLKQTGVIPLFISRKLKLPVGIKYSEGLGNDRICSAVAAYKIFNKKNILIIDFGTATTFTMLSNGIITGGMIAPGIKTSLLSLTDKTNLPEIKLIFPNKIFNNNTKDNIKAGILFQSLFTTERVIQETKKTFRNLFVIATGGFSEVISKKTCLIDAIDKLLVLKGINFILD